MEKKKNINWEKIELDYRAGIKTLRDIADENGITHGAVNKRAKRDGWVRDLTAKIKAKADYLVSVQEVSSQVSKNKRISESAVIDGNAQKNADVDMSHRWISTLLCDVNIGLLVELQEQNEYKAELEGLGEMLRKPDQNGIDKLNDIYKRAISLSGRVDNAKKITESIKVSVELQRRVYKIDDNGTDNTFEDWLRKQRNGG